MTLREELDELITGNSYISKLLLIGAPLLRPLKSVPADGRDDSQAPPVDLSDIRTMRSLFALQPLNNLEG